MRKQYGRHVNFDYLPPKIKFGAFRLKLANKMQESPDRHRQQWTYRLNCTDTIYCESENDNEVLLSVFVYCTSRKNTDKRTSLSFSDSQYWRCEQGQKEVKQNYWLVVYNLANLRTSAEKKTPGFGTRAPHVIIKLNC